MPVASTINDSRFCETATVQPVGRRSSGVNSFHVSAGLGLLDVPAQVGSGLDAATRTCLQARRVSDAVRVLLAAMLLQACSASLTSRRMLLGLAVTYAAWALAVLFAEWRRFAPRPAVVYMVDLAVGLIAAFCGLSLQFIWLAFGCVAIAGSSLLVEIRTVQKVERKPKAGKTLEPIMNDSLVTSFSEDSVHSSARLSSMTTATPQACPWPVAMTYSDSTAGQFAAELKEIAAEFRCEERIEVDVVCDLGSGELPRITARHMLQFATDALAFASAISQATRVVVTVVDSNDGWTVRLEDDGIGYGFYGSMEGDQLKTQLQSTALYQHVRHNRARMLLSSYPGNGGRIHAFFTASGASCCADVQWSATTAS